MLEVLGESYYIDFASLEDNINIEKPTKKTETEEDGLDDAQHISVVKFETIKIMLEVIMTEREEMDENLGIHNSKNLSLPFKIAFNTLLRHGIIKHL